MAEELCGIRFFDDYPRFLETSETGPSLDRLNARYAALIHANRALLQDKSVLDLGSHDGRWCFAALKAGARSAHGLEHKQRLVNKSMDNFREYGIPEGSWKFTQGDLYDELPRLDRSFDVVFCFGILYHVRHHMLMFDYISRLAPETIIVDTNVSPHKDPVTYWKTEPRGTKLVGHPSASGVVAMLRHYGYESTVFDWHASGLLARPGVVQYESGKRITVVGRKLA